MRARLAVGVLLIAALSYSFVGQLEQTPAGRRGFIAAGGGYVPPTGFNFSVLQARVSGTCTTPNAIASVGADGTVTCTTGVSTITNGASANKLAKSDGTNLVASALSDDGTKITTTEPIVLGETDLSESDDNTSNGTVNEYTLAAGVSVLRFGGTTSLTINSMNRAGSTPRAGDFVLIENEFNSSATLVLTHNSGAGTANRKFSGESSANCTMSNIRSIALARYDSTDSSWHVKCLSSTHAETQTFAQVVNFSNGNARIRDSATAATLSANCTSGTGSSITTGENWMTVTVGSTSTACTITPSVGYNSNTLTVTVSPYTAGEANTGVDFTGTPVTAFTLHTVIGGHTYGIHVFDH